jgi:hypothetical protein
MKTRTIVVMALSIWLIAGVPLTASTDHAAASLRSDEPAFDFQSVMIIYPDLGHGVVVLTNSDALNPDVAIEIAHRALGGHIDAILRASHLGFNYEETTE